MNLISYDIYIYIYYFLYLLYVYLSYLLPADLFS